ncbi:SAM-dependent methyltransferase [Nocardioides jiangxiensis]|uniref:Cyclopropane-fatty-acyl-phospholipid synthase family protein n=1 Tax=Nocardioides jiangxiensis TaxID=3064524 RepID=A0ABT9AZR6_9ACTN|nr:cyclopropane-fatty-acyl-phospholipid synthase family protein [Nocardioides sp. WY-20]MDO7868044.1 cyclopropane-fatty-acyl-phospholipid synthase family protein [Nocardioides sp. WY-20]
MSDTSTLRTAAPRIRPDLELWPDLAQLPEGPRARVSARVANGILRAVCRRLDIQLVHPDEALDPTRPAIVLHDEEEFLLRVGSDGLIGFGEAYLTGAWESPDIAALIGTLGANIDRIVPRWMQRLRRVHVRREPRRHQNTIDGSRSNISHHYDLSNDLFTLFLDPTLSYSSALFPSEVVQNDGHRVALAPAPPAEDASTALTAAQHRKIDRLLDQAGVGAGTRVLEIGTGWGELALRAAARGATVRTVTLSQEQLELARERVAAAGLADRVSIELLDYRLVEGEYDAVVSVEMIEAVGDEYWSTYFRKVDELLAPGGRFALQAITMPHGRMLATRDDFTWIKKYIFPGGLLPSVEAIERITAAETSLRVADRLSMGAHYAETLRIWDQTFSAATPQVRALGFDVTFLRMWHFYLAYCQGGFASGYTDVQQMTFVKESR